MLQEATKIDANKLTISSAFVLRAFIELAVNDYMVAKKIPLKKKGKDGKMRDLDLSQRANSVADDIVKNSIATSSDLRGFRNNVVQKTAASSIQSLNGFVHNKYQVPTPESLRAGWDASVPVFEAAYGKI